MTVKDVIERVEAIRQNCGDDERDHSQQDKLYEEVLSAIAEGHETPASLAREALRIREIKFERWCA